MNEDSPDSPRADAPPGRVPTFRCVRCGYDITGQALDTLCPECGMPAALSLRHALDVPTSGKAIAAFVLGIISLVGALFAGLGAILAPVAIGLAWGARRGYRKGKNSQTTADLAIAGRWCALVSLSIGLLWLGGALFF